MVDHRSISDELYPTEIILQSINSVSIFPYFSLSTSFYPSQFIFQSTNFFFSGNIFFHHHAHHRHHHQQQHHLFLFFFFFSFLLVFLYSLIPYMMLERMEKHLESKAKWNLVNCINISGSILSSQLDQTIFTQNFNLFIASILQHFHLIIFTFL